MTAFYVAVVFLIVLSHCGFGSISYLLFDITDLLDILDIDDTPTTIAYFCVVWPLAYIRLALYGVGLISRDLRNRIKNLYNKKKGNKSKMKVNVTINGTKYVRKNEKEFMTALVEEPAFEFVDSDVQEPEVKRRTLREAFDAFIESRRSVFAKSTIQGYERLRDGHLCNIMDCPVDKLTSEQICDELYAEIGKGFAVKTVQNYKYMLLRVMSEARPEFKFEETPLNE